MTLHIVKDKTKKIDIGNKIYIKLKLQFFFIIIIIL